MRVIYITTSMEEKDFKDYLQYWKTCPNPSNQNFHNKMIRSFAKDNEVIVISCRPYSKKLVSLKKLPAIKKTIQNITYEYLKVQATLTKKILFLRPVAIKKISEYINEDSLLVVDTINPICVSIAHTVKQKKKIKCVGIATDSPSNISNTRKSYTQYILKRATDFDGYIALTSSLNDLFNINKKPSLVIEGIVEENNQEVSTLGKPYFFFGGSLMKEYGIYNLIQAFKQLNDDRYRLLIAGHHENLERLKQEIGNNTNIEYLGGLPLKDVLRYEKGALANINPRPFSNDLDRYSIPSKTLEYLTSGNVTVSVKNTKLQKIFMLDAIWLKSSSVEDILDGLKRVLEYSQEERTLLGQRAKKNVLALYSIDEVSRKLNSFIKDL